MKKFILPSILFLVLASIMTSCKQKETHVVFETTKGIILSDQILIEFFG